MAHTPTSDDPSPPAGPEETRTSLPDVPGKPAAAPATGDSGSVDFAPEELRAISQDLAEKFPIPIETTELVLMDVDPHHVHAYWNITPADLAAARTNANHVADESALVLRLVDLSPGPPAGAPAHESVDIPVQGLENHWHVELWQDAKSFMAELGLRVPDGRLALLARSNPIELPQSGQSRARTATQADQSAPTTVPPAKPAESGKGTRSVAVPDPTLAADPTNPLRPTFPNVDGSGVPATAIGAGVDDIPALPASPGGPAASLVSVRTHGPVFTGSPSQLPTGAGTSPAPGTETYSSSTLVHRAEFEIQAELRIYGRGAPGGQIQLFGQQVALGPDGRFSLRKPLSDPWAVLSLFATKPGHTGAQGGDA